MNDASSPTGTGPWIRGKCSPKTKAADSSPRVRAPVPSRRPDVEWRGTSETWPHGNRDVDYGPTKALSVGEVRPESEERCLR
jgi:hypothetical protein